MFDYLNAAPGYSPNYFAVAAPGSSSAAQRPALVQNQSIPFAQPAPVFYQPSYSPPYGPSSSVARPMGAQGPNLKAPIAPGALQPYVRPANSFLAPNTVQAWSAFEVMTDVRLQNGNTYLKPGNPMAVRQVPQPTHLGIATMAACYHEKYGIDITYVPDGDNTVAALEEAFAKVMQHGKPVAVIVNCGSGGLQGHCTMMVLTPRSPGCHPSGMALLAFDTTDLMHGVADVFRGHVLGFCGRYGISPMQSQHPRQSDTMMCGVDALQMAKDVLRSPEVIASLVREYAGNACATGTGDGFVRFRLPEPWRKTVQRPNIDKQDQVRMERIISKKGKTLGQKLEENSETIPMIVADSNGFSHLEEKKQRVFLLRKAEKFSAKVREFARKNPGHLAISVNERVYPKSTFVDNMAN